MWCDKQGKKPDQKNSKTSMKAACSWISHEKNFLEFQFWEKPTLENNSSSKQSVKWIVQL